MQYKRFEPDKEGQVSELKEDKGKKIKEKERGERSGQGSKGISCRDRGTVSYGRDSQMWQILR